MHGPILAKEIRASWGKFPGVCQQSGPARMNHGFFVLYRRVRRIGGALEQYEAVIELFVQDLSAGSTFANYIPFVIDTGTDVTIIPRKLVPEEAFPVDKAVKPYGVPVEGLTGWRVFGRTFSASLAIVSPELTFAGLGFGKLTVVVVDSWEGDFAMLGLDALRRVVIVSDHEHVSFWPLPTGKIGAGLST
jgi:hypothetical protein